MFTFYGDESKSGEKIPVVAVGGGLGTGLQWSNLLDSWREAMGTEPDVDVFHASDFETPPGRIGKVYQDWDDPRLMAFQRAMVQAKAKNPLEVAMAATVSVEEFYKVATPRRIRRFGDEYFFCAYQLIEMVALHVQKFYPNQRVNYIFEQGGPHQDRFEKSFAQIEKTNNFGLQYFKFWKTPIFAPKDAYPGLQIADKLVFEAAKHASHFLDSETWKDRYPIKELILRGWDVHLRMYKAQDIEEFYVRAESLGHESD